MKVLVTCPPMLGMIEEFIPGASADGLELTPAELEQALSEEALIDLLPGFDGWIIGDDPATRRVLQAGRAGRLKAAVKWGIGVDNVDFDACEELGLPVANTPGMFGAEVADIAVGYVIGLARHLFVIDRGIRQDYAWPKPPGMSLAGRRAGIVGFGDIGRHLVDRLAAFDMDIVVYDPAVEAAAAPQGVEHATWFDRVEGLDFLVFTCSMNENNVHMLNSEVLEHVKRGAYIVNVARGPLVHEPSLVEALKSGRVAGAALDVFETEPLPADSPLRDLPQCIFGSHNGSNTVDAVRRASLEAISKMRSFLNG